MKIRIMFKNTEFGDIELHNIKNNKIAWIMVDGIMFTEVK